MSYWLGVATSVRFFDSSDMSVWIGGAECACRALVSIKPTLDLTNQFRVKPDGSSLHQAGPDGLIFGGVYPGTDVLNEVPFVVVSLGSPRVSYICDGGALRLCLCGCSQDDVNG